jgi:hypothetical protein
LGIEDWTYLGPSLEIFDPRCLRVKNLSITLAFVVGSIREKLKGI